MSGAENDSFNDDDVLSGETQSQPVIVTVPADAAGIRLDTFLASQIGSTSRSQIRRAVESGNVTVNNNPVTKPSYDVTPGEKIRIILPESRPLEAVPEQIPLDIVYEDEEIIVIDKPSGMVTHPGAGVVSGTLANALVYHLNRISLQLPKRGGASRPGIVHRLDVGTSGLIVAAKTDRAHLNLAGQFESRKVVKNYLSLVYGGVKENNGRIDAPIGRDRRSRVKMAVRPPGEGRTALTLYRVRERFDEFTLLDVEIKSGRTHQIRVHLAYLKHPVVGDSAYDGGRANTIKSPRARAAMSKLNRPFLHAARLSFIHPASGEELGFEAPLPADLISFLEIIRSAGNR